MLKYTEHEITFAEIPEEITLCINISGCPNHCKGCHSPHLWEDIGTPLDLGQLHKLIDPCKTGISCVCFMGGDKFPKEINHLAALVNQISPSLKIAWYSGKQELTDEINPRRFNYIKLGPYIEDKGPLNSPTTNQRLYKVIDGKLVDITSKFWEKPLIIDLC